MVRVVRTPDEFRDVMDYEPRWSSGGDGEFNFEGLTLPSQERDEDEPGEPSSQGKRKAPEGRDSRERKREATTPRKPRADVPIVRKPRATAIDLGKSLI